MKLNKLIQSNTHNFSHEPSSFSTLCTKQCKQELIGFLLSLSLHHPNAKTYIISDAETKKYIEESTPQPRLSLFWFTELDKYTDYSRQEMERNGMWSDFQMAKATIIEKALEKEEDTLLIDSDTIILDKLFIDPSKELGVSPQFIKEEHVRRTGYYNGGMLWTNQKTLPKKWVEYTKTSRYYDQASIEDLTKDYTFFEFPDNHNLQTWRFLCGIESPQQIMSNFKSKNNKIYYNNQPLKFIHTHFNLPQFKQINDFFILKMKESKLWRELTIVYRVINDKWVLQIPKQPMTGMWKHNNDSFRELAFLFKINNKDVDIEYNAVSGHCWLKPNILLYDRPTLNWLNNEVIKSSLFLLGNGSIDDEGQKIHSIGVNNVNPWIFWPRRPIILEKILQENSILTYNERTIESIFIGNYENNVQEQFRNTNDKWENVVEEFHCTKGNVYKYTQKEYLMKLRSSKYGLCLRGYGSKCHREVELMAFGTVPIITNEVSIDSYYDPPIENVHYLKVSSPHNLKERIETISKEKWEEMSKECYAWYNRNVYSKNAWNTMIHTILYKL